MVWEYFVNLITLVKENKFNNETLTECQRFNPGKNMKDHSSKIGIFLPLIFLILNSQDVRSI